MKRILSFQDETALLADAARLCADSNPLPALLARAAQALGLAEGGEVRGADGTRLAGGDVSGDAHSVMLGGPDTPPGVWRVDVSAPLLPLWQDVSRALSPFFVLALRQTAQTAEARAAHEEAERRIREVATVYEVGQAMDRVEIDRLLDMITERAAAVMDAQACSLLLRQPDSSSFVIVASFGLPDEVVENTRIFVGEGIAGRVAQSGQPLLLNSLDDDARFRDLNRGAERSIVASSICTPLRDENGQSQGVLCIRRRAGADLFTQEDLRLFSIFATQASLAVNNAQLYARLNNKLQELSTLAALSETVSSTLDLDQVLNQVADNIVDVVHFDRCRIYLADTDTEMFTARIVRGFPWNAETDPPCPLGEGVIGMVALRHMPLLVENVTSTLPMMREYGQRLGMDAFYAQPIVARGRCIGVVVVSNTGEHRSITATSIELLSTFVHQAGIAIENARFYAAQERRYAELTTLYDVSRTLAATSGVQAAAATVNDLAIKITESDAGLLLLLDGAGEGLSVLHTRGISDAFSQRLRPFLSSVPVGPAARALRVPLLLGAGSAETPLGPEWATVWNEFQERHRATALVPLTVNDAPVGFLLMGKKGGDYSAGALQLISVASSQAAAVLVSARTYERHIGQRELELSAIRELLQKLRAATALGDALNSILDIVASLVWSDSSSLLTLDGDGQTLSERAWRGERSADAVPQTLPLSGDNIAARALRERTALIATHGGKGRKKDTEFQSGLALPLIAGDELLGVLTMHSRTPNLYSEESVKMLHLVTSQAATIYREMSSLRNLTRYTDNILRSIAAGVITVDKDGIIATWNRRAEEIVNLRAEEVVGTHYNDFINMLDVEVSMRDETMRMMELTAQTGKVFTRNGFRYRIPEGRETYVNLSASQLKSEAGEYLGVVVVFEDVTGEVNMKEEVERVSKLAETGQLAANIAHELRNPLSSIKGAAQLLRNELPADYVAQHGEFLDIIVEEVNGLNRMTTEFLEFSRVTPPQMRSVDINALVSRSLSFMGTFLAARDVTVLQALDDDVPELMLDKSQIEQVVKNVVINASQAMPHGGYLTVASRFFASSGIVEMAFTDTGVGIPPDKMERIWTPFFTTKTKGTGLGLPIARKIVETHGGKLSVRTMPGEGSTFTLHLPIAPQEGTMMSPARAEITDERTGQAGGVQETRALYDSEP